MLLRAGRPDAKAFPELHHDIGILYRKDPDDFKSDRAVRVDRCASSRLCARLPEPRSGLQIRRRQTARQTLQDLTSGNMKIQFTLRCTVKQRPGIAKISPF